MPSNYTGPDGTYERPVGLPCPLHNASLVIADLTPHLDPSKWFICPSFEHAEPRRWTVCG